MIQFISRTPSTCQSSISSLIAHNPRWSSIFIKILPFLPKSSPFQIASKERMIWYSECFRSERIRDIRKIRLVWKAKKLDERGRRDYVRLCIHRVELKSERQPIRGLDQLERVPRWICIFQKGERGFSPLRSTRKAGPPPSREIGFPFRFPRFKSSRRDRGRGFPVSPREHRNDTSIRKKGPSLLASTVSLSLPLSPRSIVPSLSVKSWFCTFVRVHANFRSTRLTRLGELVPPWASDDEYRVYRERSFSREKRNLFLFRPSGYFSTEIFIPRTGICRRDLDKLGTWTLFREGFLSFQTGLAPALFIVIVVRVGLKYSIGGGEVFVWASIAIEFSKGHRRESTLPPPHLAGLNIKLNSRNEIYCFLVITKNLALEYQFEYLGKFSPRLTEISSIFSMQIQFQLVTAVTNYRVAPTSQLNSLKQDQLRERFSLSGVRSGGEGERGWKIFAPAD